MTPSNIRICLQTGTYLVWRYFDKGEDYFGLKKSFVIFICTYDPYNRGKYIYRFNEYCREEDIDFGDETEKIVVNATGTKGNISEELKGVLDYMCGNEPKTEYAKELDNAVKAVKESEEWRREYMTLLMRDKEKIKIGEYADKVSAIKTGRENVSDDILMKMFRLDGSQYERFIFFIDKYPDWDAEDIAEAIINDEDE